ncbi:MAG: hypothetical protein ACRBCL_06895 [Maritimibacter sp.]
MKPKFKVLFQKHEKKDSKIEPDMLVDRNWFYDPGPNFNNDAYGEFLGRWGANMPGGEPTIQQVVAVIEALLVLTEHFNELMAEGKAEDISNFLDATDKFADRAMKSSNPAVKVGGMMIKSMVMKLRAGLAQGHLTDVQKGEIYTDALKGDNKWQKLLQPSGTVGDLGEEREPAKI